MSRCSIIPFKNGLPIEGIEFGNAWGGAARIWTALYDRYLKNPAKLYDSWIINDTRALWDLAKREDLPIYERAVHASTFDHFYVSRKNFDQFVSNLRAFDAAYPSGECISHLRAWADTILSLDCDAVGFYGTSVTEDPWMRYDEETDEAIPVPLSEGTEVYEWLDSMKAEAKP